MGMNKIFAKIKYIDIEKGKDPEGFAARLERLKQERPLGEYS